MIFDVALNAHLKKATDFGLKQVLLKKLFQSSVYPRRGLEKLRIYEEAYFLVYLEVLKVK